MHRGIVYAVGLTGVVAAACGPGAATAPVASSRPNVVMIMVDTLRADHMSLYGYHRNTTPFIDSFSSEGVVFDWAWSQASCTFPSVNSLLTSRYPGIFIKLGRGQMGLPENVPTIQGLLRDRGYNTVAVSASPIVRSTPTEYNPSGGFDRGFDTFVEGCMWLHGGCLNAKVFAELDRVEEPFLLYAHYMEPHSPYQPPKNYRRRFAGEYDGYDFIRDGDPTPIGEMLYEDGPVYDLKEIDIQHLVDLYDDEIRSFDNVFQRLIQRLRDQGLLERTIVALVSDHGEEFLEHGHIKHCRGIWANLSHVPMVLWIPGVEGGVRFDSAVENIDLVPTLLDYLDISIHEQGFEGSSLRPLIEGREYLDQYAFADQGRYDAVADSSFHLIFDRAASIATLFDVVADPLEQHDLFSHEHPAVGPMTEAVSRWFEATGRATGLLERLAAAKAKEEELRALGYLE